MSSYEDYWSGRAYNDSPIWEAIAHGRAVVLGTAIRKRAHDVIGNRFPNSLDALEVSRLAAAVGSDLGHIIPFITQTSPTTFRLAYYLNMRDADNPEFLKRLRRDQGPVNIRDLAPEKTTFTVPDLRKFSHEFTLTERFLIDGHSPSLSIHHVGSGM